jgi:MFS transporter, PAT family, beta-lactamase induction signal transducer AmpG
MKTFKGVTATLKVYAQPRMAAMLGLGFASGLPFFLTGNTLGYWLRDEGTSLAAIGFLSWVGLAYSFKFLWAPLIDRLDAPLFGRLGRRRGWMLLTQILVSLGLFAMAATGPQGGLATLGICALVVAFSSATQDIVVDAWRIESAENNSDLGALTSAYQFGYRAAIILTEAVILIFANHLGWPVSYGIMAALMAIGLFATWKATEPIQADAVMHAKAEATPIWTWRGFMDAVIGPFAVFFRTYGWLSLAMLGMVTLYRLPDFVMGPVANPFYHDLGLSKDLVGGVRGSLGLVFSLLGIAAGGFCAARFGYMRALIIGALLQAFGIGIYAALSFTGGEPAMFGAVMAANNFGISFAGVALVTYMSSLTSLGYTATQYALLSSTYTYLGKFLKGFSGVIVDTLAHSYGLMTAYAIFFLAAAAVGLPAVVLCLYLMRAQPKLKQAAA